MAVGFPLEARRGFSCWGPQVGAGAPGLNVPTAGPYYLGMMDYPRRMHDSGTAGMPSIGSWYPRFIRQMAGRDEGALRMMLCAGAPGAGVSQVADFLGRCVRYGFGPLNPDYYGYLWIGGGVGAEGDNGFYWNQGGCKAQSLQLSCQAGGPIIADIGYWAISPYWGENALASHANQFVGTTTQPYLWFEKELALAGVYNDGVYTFAQKCEYVTFRATHNMRRVYTLGGGTNVPTYTYARGAKHLLPTTQDCRVTVRWHQPDISGAADLAWVANNFTPFNISGRCFDGVNAFFVNAINCEAANKQDGPSQAADYLRHPIEYVAQYLTFTPALP